MEQSGFELFCVIFVYNPEWYSYTEILNNDLD